MTRRTMLLLVSSPANTARTKTGAASAVAAAAGTSVRPAVVRTKAGAGVAGAAAAGARAMSSSTGRVKAGTAAVVGAAGGSRSRTWVKLGGATARGAGSGAHPTALVVPEEMAFYYGDPAQVNGAAGNTTTAAATFSAYDFVVFGEGIEQADHVMHAATQTIIGLISPVRVFGYIDLCSKNPQSSLYRCSNFSNAELQSRVDKWRAMGATGIFWDQAGLEYMVSRDRLNFAVDYTHSKGMAAFVNVWELTQVFEPGALPSPYGNPLPDGTTNTLPDGNPNRLPTSVGTTDYCLLESFAVVLSDWAENWTADPQASTRRGGQMVTYHNTYGTKGASVNTVASNNPPFDQAKADYVWWLSTVYGLNAVAWGETWVYSSDTNALPFRTRPGPTGVGQAILPLSVTTVGSQLRRTTTTGTIIVDTAAHTGAFYPAAAPGQTILDDFNDNVFTSALWTRNDATRVTETGGRLRISLLTTAGYYSATTTAAVAFAGKWYGAKLVTAGDQSHTSQQIYPARLDIDSTHGFYWYLSQNSLTAYTNVAGTVTQRGTALTYNATTHAYLAVGESGGNIVWKYSADGTTWTTHTSLANPFGSTTGTFIAMAGTASAEATTANVEWDDYSVWQ